MKDQQIENLLNEIRDYAEAARKGTTPFYMAAMIIDIRNKVQAVADRLSKAHAVTIKGQAIILNDNSFDND